MNVRDLRTVAAAVAAVAALSACGDETGPDAVDDALLADMAVVAADAALEDVALMTGPFGFGPGTLGAVAGAFHHGPPGGGMGIGGELSGTRSVTFYDAAGAEQAAYDAETTASIHFVMELAGAVDRGRWSAEVDRTRDETVSGLAGQETTRTFNGTGTEAVSRSRHLADGVERSYEMEGTFTKTDVVVPVPGSDPRWPLSGTIRRTLSVVVTGPAGNVTRTVDVTITFDGDETAAGVINGQPFEVDLSTRPGGFPLRKLPGGR